MNVNLAKADRRVNRTRRSLSKALVDLIHEKRFDDITVQDVIDKADVGRSTFYSHFRDKEDLFQKDWEGFLDRFAGSIDWEKAGEGRFVPVCDLFRHLQEYHHFYKSLVRSRKTDAVFKSGAIYLADKIEAALERLLHRQQNGRDGLPPVVPIPVLSNYFASELFALLKWWLDHNMPYTPERMDEIFHELVMPGFRSAWRISQRV